MRLGLELTFVPDLPGRDKEFTSEAQAQRAAKRLFRLLKDVNYELLTVYDTILWPKAERFRRTSAGNVQAALGVDNREWEAWIVEVVNLENPTDSAHWKDKRFVRLMQRAFDVAKSMGLLPRIRRRGVHVPTGGGHIHHGITDLFSDDTQFTVKLAAFEKALFVEYANRPYIRWLFSEWFDVAHNSRVSLNLGQIENADTQYAYLVGLYSSGINRRFSCDQKLPYFTFEHRYFDMPPNARQLALQMRFLIAWIEG